MTSLLKVNAIDHSYMIGILILIDKHFCFERRRTYDEPETYLFIHCSIEDKPLFRLSSKHLNRFFGAHYFTWCIYNTSIDATRRPDAVNKMW